MKRTRLSIKVIRSIFMEFSEVSKKPLEQRQGIREFIDYLENATRYTAKSIAPQDVHGV